MSAPYLCDPDKNVWCRKTECYKTGGDCYMTLDPACKKQSRLIIFEGPECVGKTTIVQKLADEFSARVQKGVRIKDRFLLVASVVEDIKSQIARTSVGDGEALILFDRWTAISDIVYEKYCYGKVSIMESILPEVKSLLKEIDVTIVYLNVDKDEMIRRFDERGDKLRTREEALMVYDAYEQFFGSSNLVDFIGVSLNNLSPEEAYVYIKMILNL